MTENVQLPSADGGCISCAELTDIYPNQSLTLCGSSKNRERCSFTVFIVGRLREGSEIESDTALNVLSEIYVHFLHSRLGAKHNPSYKHTQSDLICTRLSHQIISY